MPDHRHKIILLPPNRVWRTYPGGKTLDRLAGVAAPADSHLAEDWIASTTPAANPSRMEAGAADEPRAGVSRVLVGHDPVPRDFAELLASDPDYFLGTDHVQKYGAQPQVLVKFLDSGTRLHFQVHPTREFARRVLNAPSGKTEAYHVLAVRDAGGGDRPPGLTERPNSADETTGYIYVGFQRPPSPAQLREYILTQDIGTIASCFDPVAVRPGDTFLIPGGTPHALGAGIFMVEIQEPSDLVVRFEFERAGYVLPESSRFMGRDVDFALSVFNLTPLSASDLETRVRCRPRRVEELGPGSWRDLLIGPEQTDCFRVAKTRLAAALVRTEPRAVILIITSGAVFVEAGGESHRFDTYQKFFLPAGIGPVTFTPVEPFVELLECFPPT